MWNMVKKKLGHCLNTSVHCIMFLRKPVLFVFTWASCQLIVLLNAQCSQIIILWQKQKTKT